MTVTFEEVTIQAAKPAVVKKVAVIKVNYEEEKILTHLGTFDLGWKLFSIILPLAVLCVLFYSLPGSCDVNSIAENCEDSTGVFLVIFAAVVIFVMLKLGPAKAAKSTILKLKGWDGESEYRLEAIEN